MSGFNMKLYNDILKDELFKNIREYVIKSCELMVKDSLINNDPLKNHEDKIKNRLVFKYLRNTDNKSILGFTDLKVSFDAENSEHYSSDTDIADGKLDIKVSSEDTLLSNERYYTIECKRLDGNKSLNKKYIDQGVSRFVKTPIKYASAYRKNFMLGFLVKNIDIHKNTLKLNKFQNMDLLAEVVNPLSLYINNNPHFCVYNGHYKTTDGALELQHIFYNISDAIQ